jgi:hypothetical protein
MLSIHLRLGLPSRLFPPGFPNNYLYTFLFSPIHATRPANLILLDFIILINISFILGWSMKIQNNNMKPATSQYFIYIYSSEMSRIAYCLMYRLTDRCEFVSLTCQPCFIRRKIFW